MVPASDLEMFVYPALCRDLGWAPRSWRGNTGVAKYLGWKTKTRYERIEMDGKVSNVRVYEIPDREVEVVRLEQGKRKRAA
jgi:hypothetical protein